MEKHYSVIDFFLEPVKEQSQSIRDTLYGISQVLYPIQMIRENKVVNQSEMNEAILSAMFKLGYYPFWQVHGAMLRPVLLNAIDKPGDVLENFFTDAIPTALTILQPNKQLAYFDIKKAVIAKYKE